MMWCVIVVLRILCVVCPIFVALVYCCGVLRRVSCDMQTELGKQNIRLFSH